MNVRTRSLLTALTIATALLGGCRGGDDRDAIASAQGYLGKQDYKSAIIQLKTALQRNPKNSQARLLLGQSLLEAGDAAAATVELRKAIELGAADAEALPLLARALLAQGEWQQVTLQFAAVKLDSPTASADLKTSLATAQARLGERDRALETVLAALQDAPQFAPALLLHARILAADGDFKGALARVEQVLANDPKQLAALMLEGDIQRHGLHDREAALATYRAAVAGHPRAVVAHTAIISMLLDQPDVEGARAQLRQLETAQPKHPETHLYQAQLAFIDKDYAKARDLSEPLLKTYPDDVRVLQLSGAAELKLNSLALAETRLGQVVKLSPQAVLPRQLLGQVYLRTGQAGKALDVLQPILASAAADSASLTLAGQAYLQKGELASAEAAFTRAAKIDPKATVARTALALDQMSRGHTEAGFAELEAVAAAEKGMRASLVLITARLRRNDADGALKAIDTLIGKQPGVPIGYVLRGGVQAQRKDTAAATASYEKALSIDPLFYPATAGLAALDFAAGQPDKARGRFEALLRADPRNYRALLGLAELKTRTGASKAEVTQAITAAAKASPGELAPRILLVNYLLGQHDAKAGLAAAQDASAARPDSVEIMDLLGSAQLAAGQAQQAVSTYTKLAALRPDRPEPELRLGAAHAAAQDFEAAKGSFEHALKIKPGLAAAQHGLAELALRQKQPDRALVIARAMQKSQPRDATGFIVEAEAELGRGRPDAAAVALRTALQLGAGSEAAVKLHIALSAAGRKDDAQRLATTWQKDHPRDAAFRYYLGDTALAQNDLAAAESHYRSVLEAQPDNALAMNNIAWLLTRQNKPGAVAMAEQANRLLPDRPALMDTLAFALALDNQGPRAVALQKKAILQAPDETSLRLTLARIYLQAGSREQARTELDALAKLGDKFQAQGEVAELLKHL